MPTIDKGKARQILWEEAAKASGGYVDRRWQAHVEALSKACEGASMTHIAVLGTAMLAKCTEPSVNVFALKASVADNGYSARSLCKEVLAPNARELDISLGVTGPEPLNNQPYFGKEVISRDMNVKGRAQAALNVLCDILDELQELPDETAARSALRAFIVVRRKLGQRYAATIDATLDVRVDELVSQISVFVSAESDGGRRAQAAVAALLDVFAGPDRVDARKINEHNRRVPGDVAIGSASTGWERVIEVRDKPVTEQDLRTFADRVAQAAIGEAVVVAVARGQQDLPLAEVRKWAAQRGVSLSLFTDWNLLIRQVLLWSPTGSLEGAKLVPGYLLERLKALDVPEATATAWAELFPSPPRAHRDNDSA